MTDYIYIIHEHFLKYLDLLGIHNFSSSIYSSFCSLSVDLQWYDWR